MPPKSNLEPLKARRKLIKGNLTRFKNFLNAFVVETDEIEDLKFRLEKVKDLLDEFFEVESGIFDLEQSEEQYDLEIEAFESSFYTAVGIASSIINRKMGTPIQGPNAANATTEVAHANPALFQNQVAASSHALFQNQVKLPTISIPTFSGAYEQWLNFRDTYKSLIHNHAVLSKIEKFHYLRSALSGEAADQIQALETTEVNYDIAWELLQERYENQNLIIGSHLDAIFDIAPLQQESYSGLRQLYAAVEKHLRSLKALGLPVDSWDVIVVHIIASKLDSVTLRDWKGVICTNKIPTLKEMLKFINDRCQVLQSIKKDNVKLNKSFNANAKSSRNSAKTLVTTDGEGCIFCKGSHLLKSCSDFLKFSIKDRIAEARKLHLCLNCLKTGHKTRDCRNKSSCTVCNKRHNTIVHLEIIAEQKLPPSSEISAPSVSAACNLNKSRKKVLLATAVILVSDKSGNTFEVRALLDSASQSNFVTQDLSDRLQLTSKTVYYSVSGIGSGQTKVNKRVSVSVRSRLNSFKANLSCLVLPVITSNIPGISFDCEGMNIPDDLPLADPEFNESAQVEMLIGASLFWDLLCQGQVRLGRDQPLMQKTHFGWILSGSILIPKGSSQKISCHVSTDENRDPELRQFWEIEDGYLNSKPMTPSEEICEAHFKENTFRTPDGKFCVTIPLRGEDDNMLGESREMALNRFLSLERKWSRDSSQKSEYVGFMQEYIKLGHMTKIKELDKKTLSYYIPHHPVIKPMSTTTQLRVVFNASAKTTNGKSFNDVQLVGPTIQRDILAILLSFRKHTFAFTADITKMYRMVLVNEKQRSLQRIFWRSDPSQLISCYELNTVTYGTAAASFLAIRCLKELAEINKQDFPLISDIIMNCFSVDDVLSGSDNLEELIYIQRELTRILASGGFELRKWSSNNREFLNTISKDHIDDKNFVITATEGFKALGLAWNHETDDLSFCVDLKVKGAQVTKRQILSCIAQIFDPLGLITPITTNVKVIMQRLWQLGLSWDEAIPLDLRTKWLSLKNEFNCLSEIRVSRHVMCRNPVRLELHGFCDASELAYGTCVYIRSIDEFSNITVRLLSSKGRVAPLKRLSIPRLELCGAVILSQLVVKIIDSLNVAFHEQCCWSDSTVVLAWIKGCPSRWKTFVSNRVTEIQGNTNAATWRHISGTENPADLLSRGVEPRNLINNDLWWHGPPWLTLPVENWPHNDLSIIEESIPEQKTLTLVTVAQSKNDLFDKFSSFSKLRRVIAYCLRFAKNALVSKEKRAIGCLSVKEIDASTISLIKLAQNEAFSREILALSQERELRNNSNLLRLSPFLKDGLLRVGGRLGNSNFEFDKKHPILLPKNHNLTKLIIKNEHERLLHAGPQAVLASVRETYWPINGRVQVKQVIDKCYTCFRVAPKTTTTHMGELPISRITPTRPFLQCGVDYAGPFLIKDRRLRGAKLVKGYICLFVCFVTKAIHLELVGDLTTDLFISALKRFASRRGRPSHIYSDNGTNFVGAERELSELFDFLKSNESVISERSSDDGIQWHFIPPRAPHFGGLWEAGVKSTKTHLKKVLMNSNVTYEDFNTILVQIEGCLNSRPLSPLSEDPNDLQPLTPAHFLVGEPLSIVPDPDLLSIPENRLSRFQRMQQLDQHFWKRWSREYLSELQVRRKWEKRDSKQVKLGSLVVLKEDNTAPAQWKIGRVIEAYPGKDGIARVFSVRTATGTFRRALSKLCPIPCDKDIDD